MTTDENGKEFSDNGERAIFFARGVLETVKKLRWNPDIIHCQGWMGSVIPFYVKTAYKEDPQFANSKIVTSLFDSQPSNLGDNFKKCLEFREADTEKLAKYNDKFDFLELGKLAIDYSDGIIGVGNRINNTLVDYAKSSSKDLLLHTNADEEVKTKYAEFYNKIIG